MDDPQHMDFKGEEEGNMHESTRIGEIFQQPSNTKGDLQESWRGILDRGLE